MSTQTPIFIISSGRAGSTWLAKMIHRHPRILCVSDILEPVGPIPYFERGRHVSGEEFFDVVSAPSFRQRIEYWRGRPTDELLFLPEDDDLVSLLLTYTVPFLEAYDPMGLFEELKTAVHAFGRDSMPNQLIRCFDWLRDRFGREVWVERTGGSLPHTREIIETWPGAKIVHNYRDPRETTISMMTGSFFRLYLELEKNPDLGEWDSTYMPPLEEMGAMLDRWIVNAVAALAAVPDHHKMDLTFEDLMDDTASTLLSLSCFIFDRDAPTREDLRWAEGAAATLRRPPLRFPELSPDQRQRLDAACYAGRRLLGYREG